MTDPNWQELKPHFWRNARAFLGVICGAALAGGTASAVWIASVHFFGWIGLVLASLVMLAGLTALVSWRLARGDARHARHLAEAERLRHGPV